MATTTTEQLIKDIPSLFISGFEDASKWFVQVLWSALITFLHEHWLTVLLLIFGVMVLALFKAMIGEWGMLGSLLYNLIYFGTLFIIGLIWGPEFFLNDFFNAFCAVILYPVCYKIVGLILKKLNFI